MKTVDIISVGTLPKELYFITKGEVIVGSKEGIYRYLTLPKFSYFGDAHILFNLKSSNAYM
jgi:hypothetical protein